MLKQTKELGITDPREAAEITEAGLKIALAGRGACAP